jgi:hypothetical protein
MKLIFPLLLFVCLLSGKLSGQNSDELKTGMLGINLNLGHNSIYGAGGLSILFRPVNEIELTASYITGNYEGIGYYIGLHGFILPYKMRIKTSPGPICFNPFFTFGFSSFNSNSFVSTSGPNETSYHVPRNQYLNLSTGCKIELPGVSGHEIEDHFFLNFGISYRYSLTNNKIEYESGYFDQAILDDLNNRAFFPLGFSVGVGFYFEKFLKQRKLQIK